MCLIHNILKIFLLRGFGIRDDPKDIYSIENFYSPDKTFLSTILNPHYRLLSASIFL